MAELHFLKSVPTPLRYVLGSFTCYKMLAKSYYAHSLMASVYAIARRMDVDIVECTSMEKFDR